MLLPLGSWDFAPPLTLEAVALSIQSLSLWMACRPKTRFGRLTPKAVLPFSPNRPTKSTQAAPPSE